jgi:multisubunit Na+/H+ antiporter MnhE subunit
MDWLLLLFSNNFSTKRLLLVVLFGVIWGALSAKFSLWVTVPGMVVTAVVVWLLPIKKKDRAKQ